MGQCEERLKSGEMMEAAIASVYLEMMLTLSQE